MGYTTKEKWRTITRYDNGFSITRPNAKKVALDLTLKAAGTVACYSLGMFAGEMMDNVPYVSHLIPQAVDYVSGIDVAGNIDGLVGLLGGLYGLKNSGTETFKDNPERLETIELSPVKLTVKR